MLVVHERVVRDPLPGARSGKRRRWSMTAGETMRSAVITVSVTGDNVTTKP